MKPKSGIEITRAGSGRSLKCGRRERLGLGASLSRDYSVPNQRKGAKTQRRRGKTDFEATGRRSLIGARTLSPSTPFAALRLCAFALRMLRPTELNRRDAKNAEKPESRSASACSLNGDWLKTVHLKVVGAEAVSACGAPASGPARTGHPLEHGQAGPEGEKFSFKFELRRSHHA